MHKIRYITDSLRRGAQLFYNSNSIPVRGNRVLLPLMPWKCEKPTYPLHSIQENSVCSRFPCLCSAGLQLWAHIQTRCSLLVFFWCCAGLLWWQHQTWHMEEKQQEQPWSCFLVDVSDIQHRRRENQKADMQHRHAVLHAYIAYQNFPGGDSRSKTS